MARNGDPIIVGLDIGTTKVCCIVGEVSDDGIDIIGIGSHPSKGLRKGVVVNIDLTVSSIKKAVEEAEHMAGCEISTVYAGIAGGHIKGYNANGIIAIKDREVTPLDVERVLEQAKAFALPMDREVIHAIPQEFIVDSQDGIKEPVGMSGVRLEAKVHLVTAAVTSAQNIVKCAQRCGLNVADIVLEQLASAEATVAEDEREIGCALIDIGGGTTDIVLFADGSVVHTSVIALGGLNLTSDISQGLRTPMAEAERIKQQHGCAVIDLVNQEETIEVPSVGGRPARVVPRRVLCEIVEPRMEELFLLIQRAIADSGYQDLLGAGCIVTGGTTIMEGVPELAESVLQTPVRRGMPTGVGGLVDVVKSPMYATGVGLVLFGSRYGTETNFRVREENVYEKVMRRMGDWLKEIF